MFIEYKLNTILVKLDMPKDYEDKQTLKHIINVVKNMQIVNFIETSLAQSLTRSC